MKIAMITPDGVEERELTAEEISAKEILDASDKEANDIAKANEQAKEDLKASAKAKLVAGTKLTEDEANTIVL